MQERLARIGCRTLHVGNADNLVSVPGFAHSVVVAMCNSHVTKARKLLLDLGCRLVWINCMTFLVSRGIAAWRLRPADA